MTDFRFFDSRQKYLLFVTTTNEKSIISEKITPLIKSIQPNKSTLKIFDAGLGDGTLLMNVLRNCHKNFPESSFLVLGKEVSMEDVRLTIEKLSDRFVEHPNMVFVLTNLHYNEAIKLESNNELKQKNIKWEDFALTGNTSYDFNLQLSNLDSLLKDNWQVERNPLNGNTTYKNASVLIIYREDQKKSLLNVIPKKNDHKNHFDLIIASQPYRSRISEEKKVNYVIKPMIEALSNNGKLAIIHAYGNDPGTKLVQQLWPHDNPFPNLGNQIISYIKENLNNDMLKNLIFHTPEVFKYSLRALPNEIENSISTSLVFSAWNNINYVAQVNEQQIKNAEKEGHCYDLLSNILKKYEGLYFNDEIIVIEKK